MPFPRKSHGTVKHIFKGLCFYFFKNSLEYECDFFLYSLNFFPTKSQQKIVDFVKKKRLKVLNIFKTF